MDYSYTFLAAFFVVLAVELILQLTWNKAYFRSGLRLLSLEQNTRPAALPQAGFDLFKNKVNESITSRFVFKALSDHELAFREKLWGNRMAPVMRGLITYDNLEGKVKVKGFAYWHILVIILDWCAFLSYASLSSIQPGLWLTLVIPLLLTGIAYWLQARKFRKILGAAAEVWSTKVVPPSEASVGARF